MIDCAYNLENLYGPNSNLYGPFLELLERLEDAQEEKESTVIFSSRPYFPARQWLVSQLEQ